MSGLFQKLQHLEVALSAAEFLRHLRLNLDDFEAIYQVLHCDFCSRALVMLSHFQDFAKVANRDALQQFRIE